MNGSSGKFPIYMGRHAHIATRSIYGRCDRHHHHDHGVGTQGAACGILACLTGTVARLSDLRTELRVPGHLLEQSPSHAAGGRGY